MKVYVPDTNVLMLNPDALHILTGSEIPDDKAQKAFLETLEHKGLQWDQRPNDVVLCDIVQRELDHLSKTSELNYEYKAVLARRALSHLEDMTTDMPVTVGSNWGWRRTGPKDRYGRLNSRINLQNKADVFFSEHNEADFMTKGIPFANNDDRIIFQVMSLIRRRPRDQVIFVSADRNARTQARLKGIETQDFEFENVRDSHQLYKGITYHPVPQGQIGARVAKQIEFTLAVDEVTELVGMKPKPNQVLCFANEGQENNAVYYILKGRGASEFNFRPVTSYGFLSKRLSEHNSQPSVMEFMAYCRKEELERTLFKGQAAADRENRTSKKRDNRRKSQHDLSDSDKRDVFDDLEKLRIDLKINNLIMPIAEQIPYIALLMDRKVEVMTVDGSAGTGKTYFALLLGLLEVMRGKYDSIKYIKPVVTADEGLGFLKGDLREKMNPLIQPAISNFKEMFCVYDRALGRVYREKAIQMIHMFEGDLIEYFPITYEAGNTWRNQFVIIDETQLLTRDLVRLCVGRCGEGSKLVFLGDLAQVATSRSKRDFSYITERNSGLAHLIDRLPGREVYGHVRLPRDVVKRSVVAKLANDL
ncbi:MAG: PhoH family protein [archaeon]